MTFRINDFLARGLTFHGSRPTNFEVQLSAPSSIIQNNILDKARFLCTASSIPPSQVNHVELKYFGRAVKIKGDRVFRNWDVTVINDEDYSLRTLFEAWHNGINAIQGNFMTLPTSGAAGYKQDLIIRQFSKDGFKTREYTMVGAFPTSVEPMNLNWEASDRIGQYDVQFAYDYWLPNDKVSFPGGQTVNYNVDPSKPEGSSE